MADTPDPRLREIMAAVRLPVRVMLRPDDSMSLAQESERQSERGVVKSCQLDRLTSTANKFAQLQVDGLVLGYICDGHVDQDALRHILAAVPDLPVTFHRAVEQVQSPLQALTALKSFGQIDRLLVRVSEDGDGIPLSTLQVWQQHASPEIRLVAGVGLNRLLLQAIGPCPDLSEIHIGRGARYPETNFGRVSRIKVAQWKSALLWA